MFGKVRQDTGMIFPITNLLDDEQTETSSLAVYRCLECEGIYPSTGSIGAAKSDLEHSDSRDS